MRINDKAIKYVSFCFVLCNDMKTFLIHYFPTEDSIRLQYGLVTKTMVCRTIHAELCRKWGAGMVSEIFC